MGFFPGVTGKRITSAGASKRRGAAVLLIVLAAALVFYLLLASSSTSTGAFVRSFLTPYDHAMTFAPLHHQQPLSDDTKAKGVPLRIPEGIEYVPTAAAPREEKEVEVQEQEGNTISHHVPALRVAITVLFTSSHKTPQGIPPSIDGAFTLKHSVINVLRPAGVQVVKASRTVGLPTYSEACRYPTDGVHEEVVRTYRFTSRNPQEDSVARSVELRFVALVTPELSAHDIAAIRRIGYEVWITHAPLNASEIRNKQIREETLIDGAMGIQELTKLEGLRMDSFDRVIMVDCDVMFHRPFDELLWITQTMAWTKGGWDSEKINGGFLVFSPRATHAKAHLNRMVEILREGDFRPGTGWRGKGIGWTYGGRTIQGVLPHYLLMESQDVERNAHVEISRCRYNNMVQLPPCKALSYSDVTSNHFTGDCIKPWICHRRVHPLCAAFVDAWFETYRRGLLVDTDIRDAVMHKSELESFARAMWRPSGGDCPMGRFVSLGQVLITEP